MKKIKLYTKTYTGLIKSLNATVKEKHSQMLYEYWIGQIWPP